MPLRTTYKSFILANLQVGHRIYFGVAIEGEHWHLKSLMEKYGEPYYEKEEWGFSGGGVDLSRFRRKKEPVEKLTFLFGSTDKIPIIESAIDNYEFEWSMTFLFPFLVARQEPQGWRDQLENFMKDRIVTREMIEESRCFITTQLEHAIEIVSNKLTRTELEGITLSIATSQGIAFKVVEPLDSPSKKN